MSKLVRSFIALTAAGALVLAVSPAHAGHPSPGCAPEDSTVLLFEPHDDVRENLPSLYLAADGDTETAYVGICGGGDEVSEAGYLEAGLDGDGAYVKGAYGEDLGGEVRIP